MGISRQIAKSKITKNEIFLLVVIVNVHIYRNVHTHTESDTREDMLILTRQRAYTSFHDDVVKLQPHGFSMA